MLEKSAEYEALRRKFEQSEFLKDIQAETLKMIAKACHCYDILLYLVNRLETSHPGMHATVLLMDEDGKHLRPLVAPSVPDEWTEKIDFLPIGSVAGSCGTAAYRRERVVVEDIASDPLWARGGESILKFGFKACWSEPILSESGNVLGTFAIYFKQIRSPLPHEIEIIESVARLSAVVIEREGRIKELARHRTHLEALVEQSTADLHVTNRKLRHEIIERRRVEDVLRQSRKWLKTLVDRMPVGVVVYDSETGSVSCNIAAQNMLGTPASRRVKDVTFKPEWEFLREDGTIVPLDEYPVYTIMATKKPLRDMILGIRRPDTSGTVWGQINGDPLHDSEGNISHIIVTLMDISEHRKTHEALKQSETRFRSIIEQATDAIYVLDNSGRFVDANPTACKNIGYTREELLRLSIREVNAACGIITGADQFLEELKRKKQIIMDTHHQRKDGSFFPVEVNLGPLEFGDQIFVVAIARDMTERKMAEQNLLKYKCIVSHTKDLMMLLDRNYVYDVVNDAYLVFHGRRREDVIGHSVADLHGEEFFRKVKPYLERAFIGEPGHFQIWLKSPVFGWRYLDVFYSPFFDSDDTIPSIVINVRDVSEFKDTQEKLEASLKEKEVLLRELYHRTKNNIQVINSLLTLESAQIQNQQTLGIFQETKNRIYSMALVHEKLYQSGNLSRIDFGNYIDDLVKALLSSYRTKTAEVSFDLKADAVPVLIDTAVPCGLVINEIISNSLKYAFPEDRNGEIRIALSLSDDREIILEIADNGIGMPEVIDFRNTKTLGFQLIISIIELQLKGKVELIVDKGTKFIIKFRELSHERV